MVNEIKQAIANILHELFPNAEIYDEDVPQGFKTPSFLIIVVESSYKKAIDEKYNASVSFDLAYFPEREYESKNECYEVSQNILRAFDVLNSYKVTNKTSSITDNVLHVKFTVKYREIKTSQSEKMRDIIFN
jgi:hypothetical protein